MMLITLERQLHIIREKEHNKCMGYITILHNLYPSPSIIKIMKSRRMRWAGYVVRMREKRNPHRLLVGKSERK
jgi:hypothetical protein